MNAINYGGRNHPLRPPLETTQQGLVVQSLEKYVTPQSAPSSPSGLTWSARLILNYKKLPYRTHWLEFPDIAPHLKSLGIPPNAQGKPYTVPTIHFPSTDAHPVDEYIMDSKAIAIALEKAYPDPPLHLDAPQLAKAEELRGQAIGALMGPFAGKGLALLNERSKEYMATANLAGFAHGEEAWDGATPVLEAIGALLKEKGGPFVLGETGMFSSNYLVELGTNRLRSQCIWLKSNRSVLVSYADFILVSTIHCLRRAGEDLYEKWVEISPECGRLYDASKQWLDRDQ